MVHIDIMAPFRIARRVGGWDTGTFDSMSLLGPLIPTSTQRTDDSNLMIPPIDVTADAASFTSISSRQ